ncbi:MAG: ParB/RepB/Spo0J family partition protein [Gammaproteobacteria bacterium]|nr:ParB/RepB/Spo0J family partition protein [Gammaproteobacteria bacterium]
MAGYPTPNRGAKLKELPVHRLERGILQPRKAIDGIALKKLAESIQAKGVIQPIFVRKARRGRFEIVAGERRWRAAKMAGLRSIPTVVTDVSDAAALAIALIENLHREDLNPIDQATAIQHLVEEFAMTHREVAETIAKSRATITNLLRLLELPHDAQRMVADGELTMGHARALLALPSEQRQGAAEYVAEQGLSVRSVERMVRRSAPTGFLAESNGLPGPTIDSPEPVRERFERTIKLRKTNDGRWHVSFSFSTLEELRERTKEVNGLVEQMDLPL